MTIKLDDENKIVIKPIGGEYLTVSKKKVGPIWISSNLAAISEKLLGYEYPSFSKKDKAIKHANKLKDRYVRYV